ncbi:unnamed protein product [Amoebophrya sp. A25]|nr:unnamed protein product [Amoebophrya sp. A25]|eukprot:GSA25T00014676001.1
MAGSMTRNNCTEDNLNCTPATPGIVISAADLATGGGPANKNPSLHPLFMKDAWNERSWHSMRKALNAARIADNAVREGYRYLQWSRDRSAMLEQYAQKALDMSAKELPELPVSGKTKLLGGAKAKLLGGQDVSSSLRGETFLFPQAVQSGDSPDTVASVQYPEEMQSFADDAFLKGAHWF